MINQRYHLKLLAILLSCFLLVWVPFLMFTQFYLVSLLLQFDHFASLIQNTIFPVYFQPHSLTYALLAGFALCVFVWYMSRAAVLLVLMLKNHKYFPGSSSSWYMKNSSRPFSRQNKFNSQYHWIYRSAARMARKLNIATPDIAIDASQKVNAKVLPDFIHPSLIVLSQGLLSKLTPDEIEAVVAHELAHVAMRDTFTMSILDLVVFISIWLPVYLFHLIVDHTFLYQWRDKNIGFILGSMLVLVLYGFLPLFILNALNRRYELRADKVAMSCVNPQSFVSALKAVHVLQSQMPGTLDWCWSAIPKPMQTFVLRLFSSHPPIPSRIQAVQQAI